MEEVRRGVRPTMNTKGGKRKKGRNAEMMMMMMINK